MCDSLVRSQAGVSTMLLEPRNHPIAPLGAHTAPMGCSPFMHCACCSQGGGVRIAGGTVSFDVCNIYENSANSVSVCCSNAIPHRPDGVLAFHLTGWLLAGRRCLHWWLKYPGRLPKLQHILQHRKSGECWLCEPICVTTPSPRWEAV